MRNKPKLETWPFIIKYFYYWIRPIKIRYNRATCTQKAFNSIVSSSIRVCVCIEMSGKSHGGGPDVLFVELIYKQQCRMCMWSEKLNLLQRSQNIYVIVQNLYCFALVSLSILLRFSASSIPIQMTSSYSDLSLKFCSHEYIYEISGGFFEYFSKQWLVLNWMPFAHQDVLEVRQHRVVCCYKRQNFLSHILRLLWSRLPFSELTLAPNRSRVSGFRSGQIKRSSPLHRVDRTSYGPSLASTIREL